MIYKNRFGTGSIVNREQYNRMPIYEKYNYEKTGMTETINSADSEKEFDRFMSDHGRVIPGYTHFGYKIDGGVYTRNGINYLLSDNQVLNAERKS